MKRLKEILVATPRLDIVPLSLSQLLMYSNLDYLLERDLGVTKYKRELPKELTYTLSQFIIPYVSQHPQNILFGTLWLMIDRETKVMVGDLGFKGAPSEKGLVEIGYGTYPDFENRGYMTEAVDSMVAWVFQQTKVDIILAETDKSNLPSQKILQKTKFSPFAETQFSYWWRMDKNHTAED